MFATMFDKFMFLDIFINSLSIIDFLVNFLIFGSIIYVIITVIISMIRGSRIQFSQMAKEQKKSSSQYVICPYCDSKVKRKSCSCPNCGGSLKDAENNE